MNSVSSAYYSRPVSPALAHSPKPLFGRSADHAESLSEPRFVNLPWLKADMWSPKAEPTHIRVTSVPATPYSELYAFVNKLNLVGTDWKNRGELAYYVALHAPDSMGRHAQPSPRALALKTIAEGDPESVLRSYGITYKSDGDEAALAGWDINKKDAEGYTLLHRLAMTVNPSYAAEVVEKIDGIDLNAKMPDGKTTFEYLLAKERSSHQVSKAALDLLDAQVGKLTSENYATLIGPLSEQRAQWRNHADEVEAHYRASEDWSFERMLQELKAGETPFSLHPAVLHKAKVH